MDIDYDQPEDFAADDSFVNYCFRNNKEDVAFWEQWLAGHPGKIEAAEKARHLVFLMSVKLPPEEKDLEWEKVKIRPQEESGPVLHKRRGSQVRWLTAGISFLVVVGIAAFYWATQGHSSAEGAVVAQTESYVTSPGQRHSIVLEDGTHVWLNADSRLTCDSNFNLSATREVSLVGEAYFDVAKNASRPFIIHTRSINITVLGTTLNVKAYPSDKTVEAALITGSIEVSLIKDHTRKILLKPHEKIIVFNDGSQLKEIHNAVKHIAATGEGKADFKIAPLETFPQSDSVTVETAWLEGKMVFRRESFDQLALQMERKYNVRFHFANDSLKKYHFTGIFSTETIEQALHALQLTSPSDPFDYQVKGDDVYITRIKNGK